MYFELLSRAKLGYQWIDVYGHHYELDVRRVDLATLDIASHRRCVLAQASGLSFGAALAVIRGTYDIDWATRHGFMGPGDLQSYALTAAWRQLLGYIPPPPKRFPLFAL